MSGAYEIRIPRLLGLNTLDADNRQLVLTELERFNSHARPFSYLILKHFAKDRELLTQVIHADPTSMDLRVRLYALGLLAFQQGKPITRLSNFKNESLN